MLGLNKAIWWAVVVAHLVEWSLPTTKICGSNPSKFYLSIVLHLNRKDKKRKSGWERPIFKKLNDHIIIKKESYLETYSVGREEGSGLTDKPKICESIGWKLLVFRWRRQWKNDLIWISDETRTELLDWKGFLKVILRRPPTREWNQRKLIRANRSNDGTPPWNQLWNLLEGKAIVTEFDWKPQRESCHLAAALLGIARQHSSNFPTSTSTNFRSNLRRQVLK